MTSLESPPSLSVVVPCLDAATVLPVQLEALARQKTSFQWEVVLVDNGSNDDTIAVAESLRSNLRTLVIGVEQQRGRHHACNCGIALARADRIVFVDADDKVEQGFLDAMHQALQKSPIVAGQLVHAWSNAEHQTYGQVQTSRPMEGFGFLPYAAGGCVGFRREVFDEIGGFANDKPYCEDIDISWRAQLAGFPISFEPRARVAIRQRSSLAAMYRQHRNFGEARVLLYRDYRDLGMPRRPLLEAANDWRILATGWLRLNDAGTRARWVRRFGRAVGMVRGSVKYRRFYL